MKIQQISSGTPTNLEKYQKVITAAFATTPDEDLGEWYSFDQVALSLKQSGLAYIAEIDNQPVGAIHAQPESPIFGTEGRNKWQITNIGVIPTHQRTGIGGKLLFKIEQAIRKQAANKIIVHTNPDDRRAVSFYLKYNYQPAGIVKDYYYRGPAQFFIKSL